MIKSILHLGTIGKLEKAGDFPMFSWNVEMDHWYEMSYFHTFICFEKLYINSICHWISIFIFIYTFHKFSMELWRKCHFPKTIVRTENWVHTSLYHKNNFRLFRFSLITSRMKCLSSLNIILISCIILLLLIRVAIWRCSRNNKSVILVLW